MKSEEEEKIPILSVQKFFCNVFGGTIYLYKISVAPNGSLYVRYEGDNFFAEFTDRDISVHLKLEDKFEKMLFSTATTSEIKQFMPNIQHVYVDGCVSYTIRENIIPVIAKEVRCLFDDFIQPLKQKIFREVTEEFLKSRKLAGTLGRKESWG